jgi:predicted regulator of Ras-like GTPase activity (Roadblock/LC7/MglB family)
VARPRRRKIADAMTDRPANSALADLSGPLEALQRTRGALGALVATHDGLVLAARLESGLDAEAHAAAAAVLARLASKTLSAINRGQLRTMAVQASRLTLLVSPLPIGYLLVLTRPEAELAPTAAGMRKAARTIVTAAASLT